MPTVLRANPKDELSIEYQRIQLTQYFMDWSYKYAGIARKSLDSSLVDEMEGSITSIMYSALFVESFINQLAEEFIDSEEMLTFDRCKKRYKNDSELSNTAWKLYLILTAQNEESISIDDELLVRINSIIQTRHKLVHYKPEEASRKIHRKAPSSVGMFTIDFMSQPIKVEPSLLEKEVCCSKAIDHYMACRDLSLFWCKLIGQDVGDFSRYPELEMPNKSMQPTPSAPAD